MSGENRRLSTRLGAALLQGLAVVAGILLAFAIDAGWDNRSSRVAERELLESLQSELQANQRILGDRILFANAIESSGLTLLELSTGDATRVSADSVAHLLADLSWWGQTTWETAAFDAIGSGDLSLIRNPALRFRVSDWGRALDNVGVQEGYQIETAREVWVPFLIERADLVVIGRLQATTHGTGEAYEGALALPAGTVFDHRPLMRELEFRNLIVARFWSIKDVDWAYEVLGKSLDELLAAIDEELPGDQETLSPPK